MTLTPQEIARGCLLRIVAQPDRYDQGTWQTIDATHPELLSQLKEGGGAAEVTCSTTGCVAGTAAALAGDRSCVHPLDRTTRDGRRIYMISEVITAAGRRYTIRDRGQQLLGLSDDDAAWLFAGHRVLPEVVNALAELAEGKPLSRRMAGDMSGEEIRQLRNYRVQPVVKRQRVSPTPATPATAPVAQHRR